MTKTFSVRYIKGQSLYLRFRDYLGKHYNFTDTVWDITYSVDCRTALVEVEDTDAVESLYILTLEIPLDAISVEIFDSAGKVIVDDTTTIDLSILENNAYLNKETLDKILAISEGNWTVSNNQMIFYNTSNVEIMRFNLFNKNDVPAEGSVYKRVRV